MALIDGLGADAPRVIDASTAHRVAPGLGLWLSGNGCEANRGGSQGEASEQSRLLSDSGIALIRPLVEAGLLPADYPVTVNAVSGFSGGGRSMIEAYEAGRAPSFELYGLGFEHKHLPELQLYSKLTRRPIFVPSVGNYRQGMLVSVPLHLDTLPGKPKAGDLEAALAKHYSGARLVRALPSAMPKTSVSNRRRSTAPTRSNCASIRARSTAKRCSSRGSTISARVRQAQPAEHGAHAGYPRLRTPGLLF